MEPIIPPEAPKTKRSLLGRFGKLFGKKDAMKSPVSAPTATHKAKAAHAEKEEVKQKPKVESKSLMESFTENTNLLDAAPVSFEEGKHFVTFRRDRVIVDGKDHLITKRGDDADITSLVRNGRILSMTVSAHGKISTITMDETELETLLHDLLRRGTHESNGLTISRF